MMVRIAVAAMVFRRVCGGAAARARRPLPRRSVTRPPTRPPARRRCTKPHNEHNAHHWIHLPYCNMPILHTRVVNPVPSDLKTKNKSFLIKKKITWSAKVYSWKQKTLRLHWMDARDNERCISVELNVNNQINLLCVIKRTKKCVYKEK